MNFTKVVVQLNVKKKTKQKLVIGAKGSIVVTELLRGLIYD